METYLQNIRNNYNLRQKAEKGSDDWSQYNDQMWSGIGQGTLAAANGVADILSTSLQMSQAPDTTLYKNQIAQLGNFRDGKTWDMNQLMANRASVMNPQSYAYEQIGGISDTGIAMGTLSSAASGAMTGLTAGGPWGALIGGVVGAGAGLAGGLTGKAKAEKEVALLNSAVDYQNRVNDIYFKEQADKINDYNFSKMYANRAALGGNISRKQDSLKAFADRVLMVQKNNDVTHSAGIIRKRTDGGVMIRIKTK